PSPGKKRRFAIAAVLTLALFSFGFWLLAHTIYRFATDQGDLVIESYDPAIEVIAKSGGRVVIIIDPASKSEITLKTSTYDLELVTKKAGQESLRLSTNQFRLERNGRVIVTVHNMPVTPIATAPTPKQLAAKLPAPVRNVEKEVRRLEGHTDAVTNLSL